MSTTSASLLERLRLPGGGDQSAWARFVQLYTPLLFYWTRRLGLQTQDAADLVQEVFVVLVKKLPEFRYDRDRSFRAWLRTVLFSQWRVMLRRKVPAPAEGMDDLPGPDQPDGLEAAEYRQLLAARAVRLMQADFQPATWRAFWECVVNERPPAEVAAELGLTVRSVYLGKGRVLRRLRQELQGLLD
jgi:RNA polymerase sigma-70 factor (ECF subfamily)